MSNPQTTLDSRIFAARPVALRAVALELRRNPRAAANACGPLASTRLGARPTGPGQRPDNGSLHRDRAAETANGAPRRGPAAIGS